MKEIIATDRAPGAIGPYSQATACGDLVFTSGQIPIDPKVGAIHAETIEDQTRQALDNLKAVLEAAGSGLDKVLKTSCFLSDIGNFKRFNAVYAEYFPEDAPARSCFEVAALPQNALVEVDAIAARG